MKRTIKIPLYYTSIQFRVVKNVGKCANEIYKKHGEKVEPDTKQYRGLSFNFSPDLHYVILLSTQLSHGLIAHEIAHAIDAIVSHAGSSEVDRGYLSELVTDDVYGFISQHKLQIT
jgi:hypothetical protein